jgi:hypothetical protein
VLKFAIRDSARTLFCLAKEARGAGRLIGKAEKLKAETLKPIVADI